MSCKFTHANCQKVPLSQALMQACFIMSSLSWAAVWHPQQMNSFLRRTLRTQICQIRGGVTSLRILPPCNLITASLWVQSSPVSSTLLIYPSLIQAITTYTSTLLLWLRSRSPAMRAALPPLTRLTTNAAFAMVNVQVLLGISTLLYLVPTPLAASHQAGSVALLTAMVHLLITLRRPGAAARYWRQLKLRSAQGAKVGGSPRH
jgi:hypothetical protein